MTLRPADVVIVGAGPAGALTALLLARAGVDVLLLDRAAFPRAKACGDCLSIGATAILRRTGLLDRILEAPHARLRGWRIVAPDGASFDADFGVAGDEGSDTRSTSERGDDDDDLARSALSVERAILDSLVLQAAIEAGARFAEEHVTDLRYDARGRVCGVRTRTGTIDARLTVGADGLRSVVATRLGARAAPGALRKLSLTFHGPVDGVRDAGEMHVGRGICAGVAHVDGHGRCNLTLVADTLRFGRSAATDARGLAFAAFESLPLLRGRVPRSTLRNAWLASGPFDRPGRRVAFDGAVLIGDAAGYYDPFTGQGVHQALASAELLVPHIIPALDSGDMRAASFTGYVRARSGLLRGARLVQRGIDHVLRRPATANRAIARIRRAPDFARAIISVTGDVAPVRSLFTPRNLSGLLLPTAIPENTA